MLMSGNLRKDYRVLHELEKYYKEMNEDDQKIAMGRVVKELKEGIRNTLREREKYEREDPYKWKSYKEYWDSRYCKIVYDGVFTSEDITEYKREEWQHWYNPYGDGRDCTGVWFTSSIHVFPIPAINKTVVYHFQDCDV